MNGSEERTPEAVLLAVWADAAFEDAVRISAHLDEATLRQLAEAERRGRARPRYRVLLRRRIEQAGRTGPGSDLRAPFLDERHRRRVDPLEGDQSVAQLADLAHEV